MLLTQLETKLGLTKRIGLEVLIEEAEGLANAAEIARASDRLEAIIFGAGDLSASLRARVDGNFDPVGEYPGDFWHFARVQVLAAARGAGIDAIDAPYPAYQDPEGFRRSAVHASLLGFDGKWAIHPDQIAIANEVFAPTAAEIAEARGVDRDVPPLRGRRGGGHRPRREAGRRRPHAPGGERAVQGVAGASGVAGDRTVAGDRQWPDDMAATGVRRQDVPPPGGPVGHRQHRHPLPAGRDRASRPGAGRAVRVLARQGRPRRRRAVRARARPGSPPPGTSTRSSALGADCVLLHAAGSATSTRCAGCSSRAPTS